MTARADIGAARLVCSMLHIVLEPRGYLVCLTGSTLWQGEGNDIDVILIPGAVPQTRGAVRPDAKTIRDLVLSALGQSRTLVDEHTCQGLGFKIEYHGLILDVTILEG